MQLPALLPPLPPAPLPAAHVQAPAPAVAVAAGRSVSHPALQQIYRSKRRRFICESCWILQSAAVPNRRAFLPPLCVPACRYIWIGGTGADSESPKSLQRAWAAPACSYLCHACSAGRPTCNRLGAEFRADLRSDYLLPLCSTCLPFLSAFQDPGPDQGAQEPLGAAHVEL